MANYIDINTKDISNNLIKENSVAASIRNILNTSRSSLPGAPEFGVGLLNYVFEPLTPFTAMSIRDAITSALYRYDSRIESVEVSVTTGSAEYSLNIEITFTTTTDSTAQIITVNLQG